MTNTDIKLFESALETVSKPENLLKQAHMEVVRELDRIGSGKGLGNILTGIHCIDNIILGVCPGMMDVYAAEAGSGKTSLVEMTALNFLLHGHPVLIFQRDMTPFLFYFRLACRLADVSVSEIRRYGHLNKTDVEKVKFCCDQLVKTPLHLFSPDGCSGKDVKDITKERQQDGIKVVIIDHIKTLRHSKKQGWEGIEENSNYIRESTNQTGIPHIVLAHINREGSKMERPTMSYIKGGDQLKDDADNCCLMWLPDGKPDYGSTQKTWKVNFGFDKTRWDWGGTETMTFNGPKMKFEKPQIDYGI